MLHLSIRFKCTPGTFIRPCKVKQMYLKVHGHEISITYEGNFRSAGLSSSDFSSLRTAYVSRIPGARLPWLPPLSVSLGAALDDSDEDIPLTPSILERTSSISRISALRAECAKSLRCAAIKLID